MAMKLFIAGDVVSVNRTTNLFKEKRAESIFGEMIPEIKNSDFSIVNLECPVVKGDANPIKKCGPALRTTSETVEVLKAIGFNYVTLANNHFFDYGQKGVIETVDTCRELNVCTIGGGKSLTDAKKKVSLVKDGITVTVINACEHEFSIATESHGGSNPLDLIQMDEDILEAKQHSDYVILIIHGGIEHYKYPTPRMKKWYRHFVDMGADAIINHHQHCFSGYEVYKGKPIFYGLGNFCFDTLWSQPLPNWKYGFAVKLNIEKTISFELIPYEQCGAQPKIILIDRMVFAKEIEKLNIAIADDYILNQKFNDYVINKEYVILQSVVPLKNRFLKALFRRGFLGKLYNQKQILNLKNKLYCESHHDVLKQYFGILTK